MRSLPWICCHLLLHVRNDDKTMHRCLADIPLLLANSLFSVCVCTSQTRPGGPRGERRFEWIMHWYQMDQDVLHSAINIFSKDWVWGEILISFSPQCQYSVPFIILSFALPLIPCETPVLHFFQSAHFAHPYLVGALGLTAQITLSSNISAFPTEVQKTYHSPHSHAEAGYLLPFYVPSAHDLLN